MDKNGISTYSTLPSHFVSCLHSAEVCHHSSWCMVALPVDPWLCSRIHGSKHLCRTRSNYQPLRNTWPIYRLSYLKVVRLPVNALRPCRNATSRHSMYQLVTRSLRLETWW